MESWISEPLSSNSDAIFRPFSLSNFFRQRLFSEFFCLKANEENDKMVERV